MSRLKSEDPAAAEALTSQQEGLVEGAGLRPFRPTLEGLEDRQFMDADFGDALLALLLPTADGGDPQDGHVRALGASSRVWTPRSPARLRRSSSRRSSARSASAPSASTTASPSRMAPCC